MLTLDIPGDATRSIEHLVLDFNGTLAVDGQLLPGVGQRLRDLARYVRIHVVTADTFGMAAAQLEGLPVGLVILPGGQQDIAKRDIVKMLPGLAVAIGNGRNDTLMLQAASLGICVVQAEGASAAALQSSDVICSSILDALDLLYHTDRLRATLRR